MAKRRKMGRGRSRKVFRKGTGVHRRNVISGRPMRGGIRL